METTAVMGSLALVVLILVRDVIVPMTKKTENGNGKPVEKISCPLERDLIEYRMAMKMHESELRRIADGLSEISHDMREVVNLLRREAA